MFPQDAGLPDPSGSAQTPREHLPIAGRIEVHAPPPPRPTPQPPTAPGLSAAPDILTLLAALRKRWVSAVLLGGTLGAIAAVAAWILLTPKNTGFAKLQISFVTHPVMDEHNPSQNDFRTVMRTAANSIVSRPVIQQVLKRDEVRRLNLESLDPDPIGMIDDETALKAEFKEDSEILEVRYSHEDPAVATTIANAIKEVYVHDIAETERSKKLASLSTLSRVLQEKVYTLQTHKKSLKKIGDNLGTIDPAIWREQHMEIVSRLRDAKQQKSQIGFKLVEARANLEVFESRMKSMGKVPGKTAPRTEEQIMADLLEEYLDADPEARELQKELRFRQKEVDSYRSRGFREDYISIVNAKRRAETTRNALAERKQALVAKAKRARANAPVMVPGAATDDPLVIRDQLRKQRDSLVALEKDLDVEITKMEKLATRTPIVAAEYEQLAASIKLEEQVIDDMGKKEAKMRVEIEATPRVTSFQDGALMKKDVKKQLLATAAAPLAVICAVCMGLALLEYRHRRVRSASEISRGLGIRVVGAVPRMANLERHLVGASGESDLEGTPVMESIDAIRTRLLHDADARATRLVMVTSATMGEGKTTLASHLASSLARAGRKTLLLDGDLRRPTVHELFELAMQPGFSEVLLGEVEVAEAAQETHQENLWVIPAGQWDREVLLSLARDGLEAVFEQLADEFDFIIIDSHPVLAATDALLIGRQVDAVILSVLREVSQMPRVYAAQQQLTGLGIRVLGAVVNGTDPEEVFNAPTATANVA